MTDSHYASKANAVDVAFNLCQLASQELESVIGGYRDCATRPGDSGERAVGASDIEKETICSLEKSHSRIQDALQKIAMVKDAFDSGKPRNCGGGSSWTEF